ncbi:MULTISPECIES: hypothetical protein [Streptomyces]|uniref:hypothetical protein n=1 Tax=Streptomyces TaxID=1883 RepID=UPI003243C9FF
MRRDQRLTIITEAIERLIPGAIPACLSVEVKETLSTTGCVSNTWTGSPAGLAEHLFIAVYGSPAAQGTRSPLAQAEDAKRARDLDVEVGALMAADHELTSAPWYPVRAGDMVHVHYEQAGQMPAFGETYVIGDAGEPDVAAGGLLGMELLTHTLPDTLSADEVVGMTGCFVVDAADDPLYELWFEAGPHRLTIVRDGQVVHDGAARRVGGPAAAGLMLQTFARTVSEAEGYLERGEPALALARLRSPVPLPPCGVPGPMAEHQPCARPCGHGGAHSDDPDFREGPHECPALPEQLHAVVTVGSDVGDVHFAGLYEDREAAVDHCTGFRCFREDHIERHVKPAPGVHGETVLMLPGEYQHTSTGVQLAVVVPLQVLPDPRAEDEFAAEGMATCLGPGDYPGDYYEAGDE